MSTAVLDVAVSGQSLQSVLSVSREELAASLNGETLVAAAIREKGTATAWARQLNPKLLSMQAAEHLCDALKVSVVEVFASAWAKYYELRKCAKETRDDAKSTMSVSLGEHEFTYEMKLDVDILVNQAKIAAIPFGFAMTCNVTGLELLLKAGAVHEVRGGTMECAAEIRCSEQMVWSRRLSDVHLPGAMHLAHPVSIVS